MLEKQKGQVCQVFPFPEREVCKKMQEVSNHLFTPLGLLYLVDMGALVEFEPATVSERFPTLSTDVRLLPGVYAEMPR